jgi:RNA polymerase sigma factor (sigma-70 family)
VAGARQRGDPAGGRAIDRAADTLATIARAHLGRVVAALVRELGDFELAEESAQEALVAALERWPRDGVPDRPDAWLITVGRRRAIDRLRRAAVGRAKLAELDASRSGASEAPAGRAADDTLDVVFLCCHPALSREARVALTLRVVCGLSVAEIARAFIAPEATVAQRILRAKRKIVRAGLPLRRPAPEELPARLREVLAVVYLLFNEGHLATGGPRSERPDLAGDAEWLAGLLAELMPREPEVLGLLALVRLHLARGPARFNAAGHLVLLRDQDRSLWDHDAIARAGALVVRALRMGRPGPYQIEAAIAACHAEAPTWEATRWTEIVLLYDRLLALADTPVVRLNRAIALRHVQGPAAALDEVERLAGPLADYHLFHAARAELLRARGRDREAQQADQRALALAGNLAERTLLERRLAASIDSTPIAPPARHPIR